MKTEIGEYIVGAYLKLVLNCDVVDYNVRPAGGGLKGLNEIDVIGFRLAEKSAFVCEVTTHINGLLYGNGRTDTLARIKRKFAFDMEYARDYLEGFSISYMYWSPVVRNARLIEGLKELDNVELIINGRYRECVEELQKLARCTSCDVGNPFFRMLQILARLNQKEVTG